MDEEENEGAPTIKRQRTIEKEMFPRVIPPRAAAAVLKGEKLVRLMAWNVNGLKSVFEKHLQDFVTTVSQANPDVLFLQETKLQTELTKKYTDLLAPKYTKSYFSCSTEKKGYSGTVVYAKADVKIVSTSYGLGEFLKDDEGRAITVEFENFFFVGLYVANAGQNLVRLNYRIEKYDIAVRNYVASLSKKKPVVMGGDLNVAHQDNDVWNFDAKHLKKQAGCTKEERDSFTAFLESQDRVDSFRYLHPEAKVFSFWSTRAGNRPVNRGMRLDYFIVPKSMMTNPDSPVRLHDSFILDDSPHKLSDHAPICCDVIVPVATV